MSFGYGGSGWGEGPWGDGAEAAGGVVIDVSVGDTLALTDSASYSSALTVSDAFAPDLLHVIVVFSNTIDPGFGPFVNTANYSIPGLTVTGAAIFDDRSVLLTITPAQHHILYTVTVTAARSLNGDALGVDNTANFFGFFLGLTFIAGAVSPTRVEVVFSNEMNIDAAFLNPSNYVITEAEGSAVVAVSSVTAVGDTPLRRALLELSTPLKSKEYYGIVVSLALKDVLESSVNPDSYVFQWADQTLPLVGVPLEIKIKDFSGEVSGGILGNPDGLVFFSPALDPVSAPSTIELEDLSVCTKAFDEYHLPSPPDPIPLFTFRSGIQSVIGPTSVLWATASRLGQAQMNLGSSLQEDVIPDGTLTDVITIGLLVEPIDITKAAFLNDSRWKTFPGLTHFITASNLSPIGPGPTTSVFQGVVFSVVASDVVTVTDDFTIEGGSGVFDLTFDGTFG